jgi:sigma-B regulation protein RsbQ
VGTTPSSTDRWIAERYATYEGHADDLLRLLDELAVYDAVFVGHSMSALISALAASREPDRFRHLIMIGGSPCYRDDGDYRGGFTGAQIADLLLRANADLAAWMGGFAPVMLGADATPQQITDFVRTLVAIRPDIGRLLLRSIFTSDYRALLPSVRTDVTVVQGLDDRAVPASVGRYLVAHLPCRAYHELDLSGHLPHITHPDVIGTIVAETCARTEGPGAQA